MYKILANVSEGFYASVISVLGSKMFFPKLFMDFGEFPILSYLNGVETIWVYGGISALSALSLSFTQDFMALFLKDTFIYPKINKLTRPMSAGILFVGFSWAISGFSMSMMGATKAFLLGSVSNVIGQYLADMIFPTQSRLLNEFTEMSKPIADIPHELPLVNEDFGSFNGFASNFAF